MLTLVMQVYLIANLHFTLSGVTLYIQHSNIILYNFIPHPSWSTSPPVLLLQSPYISLPNCLCPFFQHIQTTQTPLYVVSGIHVHSLQQPLHATPQHLPCTLPTTHPWYPVKSLFKSTNTQVLLL